MTVAGDFTDYAAAIRAKLAEFTALQLFWPNDKRDATAAPGGFVYSELEVMDERAVSLGGPGVARHRDVCLLTVLIYVPARSLTGTAEGYAEQIRGLFAPGSIPGVNVTSRRIGKGQGMDEPQGKYWGLPVYVSFFADRTE